MEIWLCYLIHFSISLLIGSAFCIGLFNSAQGESSVKPDGKETTDWGMIFYPITKFLAQKNEVKIYYMRAELENLWGKIKCDFRQHSDLLGNITYLETDKDCQHCGKNKIGLQIAEKDRDEDIKLWEMLLCDIEKKYKIESELKGDKIKFYKEYEEPVFSQYWTKPLLLCYKCYASIWGTIIFSLTTAFSIRTGLIPKDFYILIPMWVIFCFSLVTINMYVQKKVE